MMNFVITLSKKLWDLQTTLTMLWRNSLSITGQKHGKPTSIWFFQEHIVILSALTCWRIEKIKNSCVCPHIAIKIRQWVRKNFCGYQISNKSDAIMFNIRINCWTAESIQMCKRPGICTVMLRPIYTIRLCRIQQAYDRPTTWLKTCTTIVTELWVWFTRNNSRCRPVVSLSYATKLYHVNRPLDIWTG